MNLSSSNRNVRRISRELGMLESAVRQMLAIESGRSQRDVVFASEWPERGVGARVVATVRDRFRTMFAAILRTGRRPGPRPTAELHAEGVIGSTDKI